VVSRRGQGEGSVYKETRTRQGKNGPVVVTLWVATVEDERDPVTGSRSRVKVRAKSKAGAMEKVKAHRKRLEAGVREEPKLTVGQFLADWLAVVVSARVGHSTFLNYRNAVNIHIVPALGRYKLRDLKPEHVDRFLKAKADAGVAKRYVGRMRCIITDALAHAERRQLVSRNAGRLSIMPACRPIQEPRSLTSEEVDAFVVEAMGFDDEGLPKHRLGVMFTLMFTLGVRPGEATGFLWEDLDPEGETLSVSGSIKQVPRPDGHGYDLVRGPVKKSTAGERTLQLPAGLVPLLAAHRRRQAAEQLAAGPLWRDQGLIFASETGTPLDPSNVRRSVGRVAKAVGITGPINAYTARHSTASLRLDAGQPLDQVADLLGDDPRTVLLHYRHRVRRVVAVAADTPLAARLDRLRPEG
jgi:integrase